MRDEVLSGIGVQDMDTNRYQVSDLHDVDFYLENVELVSVLRPGIDTPFSPPTFNNFEMGSITENPILVDEEPDKEESLPPHQTTAVSEKPTETLCLREVAQLEHE